MWNAGLYGSQAGFKFAGRNSNNFIYVDDTILMTKKWKGTKELLDKSERGE